MVDAHRASQPRVSSPQPAAEEQWQLVIHRRGWRYMAHEAPLPAPRRPVPTDLVGRCFNFLRTDHAATECFQAPRCLRCHREGHHARTYKRPWSLGIAGPPPRPQRPALVMLNHRSGDVVLAKQVADPSSQCMLGAMLEPNPLGSSTLSNLLGGSTPESSPSRHALPSPLPPAPHGVSQRWPKFKVHVLPCTAVMDTAEE
jgi:hypothetical protein